MLIRTFREVNGGENGKSESLNERMAVDSLNGIAEESDTEEEKTGERWSVPEGYRFLPEELFKLKRILPPLVSLSWLTLVSSDEESGEDCTPLARLRKKGKQERKKSVKCNSLRSLLGPDDLNELKHKVKGRRKTKGIENLIKRKRGRPKKKSAEVPPSENQFENGRNDLLWSSESDSSSSSVDTHAVLEAEVKNTAKDGSGVNVNHNEHDYFKPFENTKMEEGIRRKRKCVRSGESKVSFPCSECGKAFSASSTLRSHQRIHNGTLLVCPECHKGFISKYLLKCHMRIHSGDLFMCHKCGKGFTTAELLKVHCRAHTGDRPFVCNICGKSFPTSSNMVQHKQIHNPEKKYLCSQCGSSFVQKRCLDYHMLTHSEKKNICNVCGKLWARKSDLTEHMRVHTGVKPYSCSICPQKFSQASSLKRHQIVHLEAKPISCNTCNRIFKRQEYYKRHLRKHEKKDYLFNDI